MAVTTSNIIVGAGRLYVAPSGTVTDDASFAATMEVDTYDVGATTDGVEIAFEPDVTDIAIDQLKDAAIIYQNSYRVSIRTNMAEGTLKNLAVAWGIDPSVSISGSTASGSKLKLEVPVASDCALEKQLMVVGRAPGAETCATAGVRRYFGRRAMSAEASSHSLRRGEATVFPVSFRMLPEGGTTHSGSEYGFIEDDYS